MKGESCKNIQHTDCKRFVSDNRLHQFAANKTDNK